MMPVRVARDVPAKHICLSSILNGISSYSLQSKRLLPNFGPSVQPGVDAALSRQRSPVQIRYGSLISSQVSGLRLQGKDAINLKSEA
jgi:hypothetical protein